jgi:hypothetical protein
VSVRKALKSGSAFEAAVRPGKQSLRKSDRERVVESSGARVIDSLDLDAKTAAEHGREHRWDYLLGTSRMDLPLVAAEVHPANTGEARVIVKKKAAAQAVLRSELASGERAKRWCWIASDTTCISGNTPESRILDVAGSRIVGNQLNFARDK